MTVDAYRIKFRQKDGIYSEIMTECDGTQALIITNLYCEVEMVTLRSAPFNLVEGDLIVVIVEALNVIEYSVPSLPNTAGELV